MKKKKTVIVLLILVAIAIIIFAYLYTMGGKEKEKSGIVQYPFGNNQTTGGERGNTGENPPSQNGTGTPPTETGESSSTVKDFFEITPGPVAGYRAIKEPGENNILVRYVSRKDGNIFQTSIKALEKTNISDTYIPKIHDATWNASGTYAIMRYLSDDGETIKSYLIDLSAYTTGEEYELKGKYLPDNIRDITVEPGKERALLLEQTPNGSKISSLHFTTQKTVPVFSSPFSEWLMNWTTNGDIFLTTKASHNIEGYLYEITPGSASLKKVLGNINGLTTLTSPDGKYVLYSKNTDNALNLNLYNTETSTSSEIYISTLPDKCAWASTEVFYCGVPKLFTFGNYPDDWYQGKTHFSDVLMMFNVDSQSPEMTFPLGRDINITNLQIVGNYAFFTDKNTGSLWGKNIFIPND